MSGWRSRILLALIIYFGGFASAIYALAPGVDKTHGSQHIRAGSEYYVAGTKSEAFAQAFNIVMHKCVGFAEEKSAEIGGLMRAKLAERQTDSEK